MDDDALDPTTDAWNAISEILRLTEGHPAFDNDRASEARARIEERLTRITSGRLLTE